MKNQQIVSIEEIVTDVQSGFASGERTNDGVVQLRMNNVTTDGSLNWSSYIRVPANQKQIKKYQLQSGDILFNSTNSPELVGKTAVFKDFGEPVVFSNHFVRLRVDKKRVDSQYLAAWFTKQWQNRVFESLSTQWVNQAAVRKEDLLELKLPLPPLDEQKRIASLLARADRLRGLRRHARCLIDSLLQSVFVEMFGDVEKNPKGFDVYELGEIGTLDRGRSKNRPRNAPELYGGKYPFIQTGDIANAGGYVRSYQQTYSELGLKQSKIWKAGTLCITIAANIAKTAILTFDACFPDSVVGFVPNREKTTVEYVQYWLSFKQKELEETAPESAQKNINLEILRGLKIPLPPLPLQEEFARVAARVEALRARQAEAERQAEGLFQSLLTLSFTEGLAESFG